MLWCTLGLLDIWKQRTIMIITIIWDRTTILYISNTWENGQNIGIGCWWNKSFFEAFKRSFCKTSHRVSGPKAIHIIFSQRQGFVSGGLWPNLNGSWPGFLYFLACLVQIWSLHIWRRKNIYFSLRTYCILQGVAQQKKKRLKKVNFWCNGVPCRFLLPSYSCWLRCEIGLSKFLLNLDYQKTCLLSITILQL